MKFVCLCVCMCVYIYIYERETYKDIEKCISSSSK